MQAPPLGWQCSGWIAAPLCGTPCDPPLDAKLICWVSCMLGCTAIPAQWVGSQAELKIVQSCDLAKATIPLQSLAGQRQLVPSTCQSNVLVQHMQPASLSSDLGCSSPGCYWSALQLIDRCKMCWSCKQFSGSETVLWQWNCCWWVGHSDLKTSCSKGVTVVETYGCNCSAQWQVHQTVNTGAWKAVAEAGARNQHGDCPYFN